MGQEEMLAESPLLVSTFVPPACRKESWRCAGGKVRVRVCFCSEQGQK